MARQWWRRVARDIMTELGQGSLALDPTVWAAAMQVQALKAELPARRDPELLTPSAPQPATATGFPDAVSAAA